MPQFESKLLCTTDYSDRYGDCRTTLIALDSLRHESGLYRFSPYSKVGVLATCYALLARVICNGVDRSPGIKESLDHLLHAYEVLIDQPISKILKNSGQQRYQELQLLSYLLGTLREYQVIGPHQEIAGMAEWRQLLQATDFSKMWFHSNEWMALAAICCCSASGREFAEQIATDIRLRSNPNGLVGSGTLDDQIYGFAHFGPIVEFAQKGPSFNAKIAETMKSFHKPNRFMMPNAGMCEELDALQIYRSFCHGGDSDWYRDKISAYLKKSCSYFNGGYSYFSPFGLRNRLQKTARMVLNRRFRWYNSDPSMRFCPYDIDVWSIYGATVMQTLLNSSSAMRPIERTVIWGYRSQKAN